MTENHLSSKAQKEWQFIAFYDMALFILWVRNVLLTDKKISQFAVHLNEVLYPFVAGIDENTTRVCALKKDKLQMMICYSLRKKS
jgi:hypothetical protein